MTDNIMSLKEFRDSGFLQEVNRRFFHPAGLAMGVYWNENDIENSDGFDTENAEPLGIVIYDWRDDPEGIIFASLNDDDAVSKAARVENLLRSKTRIRMEKFGWVVQPVGSTSRGDHECG